MRKFERLYVVGNGFDRRYLGKNEYGYDVTSYDAFEFFLREYDPHLHSLFDSLISGYSWCDFEDAIGRISIEDVFSNTFGQLEINEDSFEIEQEQMVAWDCQLSTVREALNFRRIQTGFKRWVEGLQLPDRIDVDGLICDSPTTAYLTFNYTETLQKYFSIPDYRVLHIHGKRGEGPLVIGHKPVDPPSYDWTNDFDSQDEIVESLTDYLRLSEKPTERIIEANQGFFASLADVREIFVVGSSWSDVDLPYFRAIRDSVSKDCRWINYERKLPVDEDAGKIQNIRKTVPDCEMASYPEG